MSIWRSVTFPLGNGGFANTTSLSFTPDASWQANDVAVAFLTWANNSALTLPSGWTQVGTTQNNGSNQSMAMAYKELVAADLTTAQTFTIATTTRFVGVAVAVPGVDISSSPIDSSSQANETAGTTIAAPAVTTVAADTWLISAWSARLTAAASPTITQPATHNTAVQSSTAFNGTTVQSVVAVADLVTQPSAQGTYGPYTATASATTTTDIGMQLALVPAAGGGSSVTGAAALSATGSLTASGGVTVPPITGEASLSAAGSLTAAGTVVGVGPAILGAADLTATATLTASGSITGQSTGAASLSATGTLTAAAKVGHTGTVSLNAAGSLTGGAVVDHTGSAALSAIGRLTATPVGAATTPKPLLPLGLELDAHAMLLALDAHSGGLLVDDHQTLLTLDD